MASTAAKYVVLLSGGGPNVVYLLRDEFLTDQAAPMGTSPITRTCEPGPGTLYLAQQDGVAEWRIVGGVLETSAASTTSALVTATLNGTTGYTRTPGLAFKHRTAANPIGAGPNETISPACGWATGANLTAASTLSGMYWWTSLAQFAIIDRDNSPYYGLDSNVANTFYTLTHVLRSVGSFVIVGDRLAGILTRGNESPTFPVVGQAAANRNPSKSASMRVTQLGGPWASDYGIATTRLAGARSVNDTFTHEAGAMWIDFMLTTLPSSGNITIDFRKQDANNYWQLNVSSAGVFALVEVVAGAPTTRASTTSVANGDRLLCVMDGAQARLVRYRTGAAANSTVYDSVATFTTQTSGVVSSLGTGGAISDLVAWPRVLSGDALAWVNAL
jgi:hypothetical protein